MESGIKVLGLRFREHRFREHGKRALLSGKSIRLWGVGCGVSGSDVGVYGVCGCRVQGLGCRVQTLGCRVYVPGRRRVWGVECKV
jgi:hypothetical protein